MTRPTHGGNLNWAARLAGCPPDAIVDFSASINPWGPPQSAIFAMNQALNGLRAYPDPDYTELKLALAQWHQLPPEWILPGNGAAELLTWAGRELSQGDFTYLLTPAFNDYQRALKAFGVEVRELSLELWLKEGLAVLAQAPKTKATGLLLNNPHNPTGQIFPLSALSTLLEEFALIVVDEAFMDFLAPDEQQSLIDWVQEYPQLVILRSLTKFYSLPGLRLGYAIAHPERLNRWQSWRDPWPVNILAAVAGIAVIKDHEFQQQTWQWLPPARQKLYEGLSSLPGLTPLAGAANFLLVQAQCSVSQLQEKLLNKHRLLIRDCLSFPELGDLYFRTAVRSPKENQLLLKGLSEEL